MPSTTTLTVLSLGGGVQSSVKALVAGEGVFERVPDCAIFADARWEPPSVYKHLEWLTDRLGFPLHVVDKGRRRQEKPKNPLNHGSIQTSLELCTPIVVLNVGIEVYAMGLCLHQFLVFKRRNVEILINGTSMELYLQRQGP